MPLRFSYGLQGEDGYFSAFLSNIPMSIKYYSDNIAIVLLIGYNMIQREVEYQGQEMSLTVSEKLISGKKYSIAGPMFLHHKGE